MQNSLSILDNIQIASPCPMSWDAMTGDERARHCNQCEKHVYNISEMTRDEAEQLIIEKEGRLCLRLHRRHDGKVMTADCPVGLRRKIKNRLKLVTAAFVATLTLIFGTIVGIGSPHRAETIQQQLMKLRQYQPFRIVYDNFFPRDPTELGSVCVPTRPRPTAPAPVPAANNNATP
jgi:hypothetical protein